MTFFFQPANITTQILNFGLPAPIDLQVVGRNADAGYKIAQKLAERISHIPGAADVHVHQVVDQPEIRLERGPRQGVANGLDAARRHQQHADLAQRQRPGRAEFLDELEQRRQLQRRRADAAVQDRFARRPAAHADLGGEQRCQLNYAGFYRGIGRWRKRLGGRVSERLFAGLRKSRSARRQHAASLESGDGSPRTSLR